jgi:N-methylhydantoinase B
MRTTGAWSASAEGDGDSFQGVILYNKFEGGTEMDELRKQSLQLRISIVPDSGGPGEHRGGASMMCDEVWRLPMSQMPYAFRTRELPAGGGVHGGGPGLLGGIWILADPQAAHIDVRTLPASLNGAFYRAAQPCFGIVDANTHELDLNGEYVFQTGPTETLPGAITRIVFNGGSGWGDPLRRDPERVVRDVRDEYVSVGGAARDYGVVVCGHPRTDPEGLSVDQPATDKLRESIRLERPQSARRAAPVRSSERQREVASVDKVTVPGDCRACGACALKSYPVLSEGGWFEVVKCQDCLATVSWVAGSTLGAVRLDGSEFFL